MATKIRRLFFDLETSPNVVYSWRVGGKVYLDYHSILEERAIICIGYKWQGEKTVRSIQWEKRGQDKALLEEFIPILESADEVVAHNGDRFDLPWLKARAAFHNLQISAYIKSIDTLQQSRKQFYFNSNRLDYLGQYLGLGGKMDTGPMGLWHRVMEGDKKSLDLMVRYCKRDVELLEEVYVRLENFNKPKSHAGVLEGKDKSSCPSCASTQTQRRGYRVTALGGKSQIMSCGKCGRNFTLAVAEGLK